MPRGTKKAVRELATHERLGIALDRSGLDDYVVAERANVTAAWLSSARNGRIKNPIIAVDKYRAVLKVLEAAGVDDVSLGWILEPSGIVPIEEIPEGDMRALEVAMRGRRWPERTTRAMIEMARMAEAQKRLGLDIPDVPERGDDKDTRPR